ncbi:MULTISPECIES: Asp-tRNA(Asn)/Glu-tRNA(Gln) amidotransferase subunit GatB [Clostridium]|jgi:aspartyl-tRNA(Asn)/glutamyl-tRNA(Gln) amidotransferase subunit B|uniref:Asp-tRNA(Asn)/Glu-tRNA(Gln) amidotransferase subunit GatB n=1 Tax=Clostridium TaxID=1485 RepID=UPI000288BFAF|nr:MULTISPECIES: Asp-tRNA(Asn)/Glu-tRNA(Gln) amidotransferase subunit GatB [Clostridium]MDF2504780.1 glutamyl-tRNA(Gln) and/or aspartyl-tRNA(Asn) amidotransferase, subunit [Clostridium sp.]
MSYETIIGLEIHAELNTKTKIFCNCSTKFGAKPNENTCPICMGLPGTLPVLNEEVVNLAVKAGMALNCKINKLNKMDRKNYFYPDLPKAYQISQLDIPICGPGHVEIETENGERSVRLNRIHIEEDAGKLVHLEYEPYSLIDYNRVGVPLIEIVTEPDMRSPQEAVTFLRTLKAILEYGGISDCRMEQGSLRCDANISLREVGKEEYNTKVEIKNINSFRELQKALEKEEKRQKELYDFGESFRIVQETRRWDAGKGRTVTMRSKEDANDYRYFPEPDIIPIVIKDEIIEKVKEDMPELPEERRERFIKEYGLSEKEVNILVSDKHFAEYYEAVVALGSDAKSVSNWMLSDMLRLIKEQELELKDIPVNKEDMASLLKMVAGKKLSVTSAKGVFEDMFKTGKHPEDIVKEKGLVQISDTGAISEIAVSVLNANPQSVSDYKAGKTQAVGYLVGQVMKQSKGKANPKMARDILEEKIKEM